MVLWCKLRYSRYPGNEVPFDRMVLSVSGAQTVRFALQLLLTPLTLAVILARAFLIRGLPRFRLVVYPPLLGGLVVRFLRKHLVQEIFIEDLLLLGRLGWPLTEAVCVRGRRATPRTTLC